jgi:hypothetical protein
MTSDASSLANYVTPGSPEGSELWRRVSGAGPESRMPKGGVLPDDDIATITDWITGGALP